MRKYKHKITNDVVVTSEKSGYYKDLYVPSACLLPGKYVENSNDWVECIELNVPIGTKFTTNVKLTIYTIEKLIEPNKCLITWVESIFKRPENTIYDNSYVNEMFEKKYWLIHEHLTTVEGIEITDENKELYWVCSNWKVHKKLAKNAKSNVDYFFTELAAQNHIVHNKPVLSFKEVSNLLKDTRIINFGLDSQLWKLIENKFLNDE